MTKTERRRIDEARELALRGSQGVYPGLERDLERAARLLEFAAPRRRTPKPKPESVQTKERQQAERESERTKRIAEIREAVFARAWHIVPMVARCESRDPVTGLRCHGLAEILDHWLGGRGRRRQKESAETCWALCRDCNDKRGANYPDAAWWNDSFRLHCEFHRLPFIPHYDARAAARTEKESAR